MFALVWRHSISSSRTSKASWDNWGKKGRWLQQSNINIYQTFPP